MRSFGDVVHISGRFGADTLDSTLALALHFQFLSPRRLEEKVITFDFVADSDNGRQLSYE